MKTIGQIRRERLLQLIAAGITFAELNAELGRNRRDATLNQVAKAAPNTTTGKPREMGSAQARQIEAALKLATGWFDTDPALDRSPTLIKLSSGHILTIAPPQATVPVVVNEPGAQPYGVEWPFAKLKPSQLAGLSASSLATVENLIQAFLGNPTSPLDWRPVALRLAAELDREYKWDKFTTLVRAIEFELGKLAKAPVALRP